MRCWLFLKYSSLLWSKFDRLVVSIVCVLSHKIGVLRVSSQLIWSGPSTSPIYYMDQLAAYLENLHYANFVPRPIYYTNQLAAYSQSRWTKYVLHAEEDED